MHGSEVERILSVLDRDGPVDTLFVFGSEAAGRATARSDLDLAALFAESPSAGVMLGLRAELEQVMHRRVDLVDLDQASPVLAMQALRGGQLVVDRVPQRRIRFMAELPGRYEDVMDLRRPLERLLRARLSHGRA